jgi:hypothetical protein
VKDEWAYDEMAAGDRVQATLVVSGDRTWLEGIVFVRESPDPATPSTRNTAEPAPGDEVPDFKAQSIRTANAFELAQYRGRAHRSDIHLYPLPATRLLPLDHSTL